MSAHTPGPWMADTVDGFTMVHVDNGGQTGQTIVHMFDRHGAFKNASANARLIAAAPAMLDALRDLIETYEFISDCEATKAREILAKADL